eukprot:COSAG01_NODE_49671_length_370_cov_0.712177_1_plen_78_part_10
MESEEQIATRRRIVDDKVATMSGWSQQAKPFFDKIKQQIELVNQGGDATVMEQNMNMQITGNPGTGKTTFARLVFEHF